MIAIIDYGVGNLFSLESSFAEIGEKVIITSDVNEIEKAEKIILPGVGAFSDAIKKLKEKGLDIVVKKEAEKGKPLLGICLGMQLLFEKSYEYGEHEGLGLIKGNVVPIERLTGKTLKIPHMGWNSLSFGKEKHELFKYLKDGEYVYFVHSYYGADTDSVIATTEYGGVITAAVGRKNVLGCQFHPEKSGRAGLSILKAFCEM